LPVPHSRRRDGDQGEARIADGGRLFEHLFVAVDGKGQISAVIFYLMAQKRIIAGLTSGGEKLRQPRSISMTYRPKGQKQIKDFERQKHIHFSRNKTAPFLID
jgi:hypothetical protein